MPMGSWSYLDILWLVLLVGGALVSSMALWSWWLMGFWFSDSQKTSPYECGFDPFSSARSPFSVRFFMVAILFLVFEVESLMFFPLLHGYCSGVENFGVQGWAFLLVLSVGLFYELWRGALEWSRD